MVLQGEVNIDMQYLKAIPLQAVGDNDRLMRNGDMPQRES